jgi:hypothetical protein
MDEDKLKKIMNKAQMAFWASVAEDLPEIKTGDFWPLETYKFDEVCLTAVKRWHSNNS